MVSGGCYTIGFNHFSRVRGAIKYRKGHLSTTTWVHDKTHKGYHSQTTKNTCQDGLPAVPYQPPPPVFPSLNYELATSSLAYLSFLRTVKCLDINCYHTCNLWQNRPPPPFVWTARRAERKKSRAEKYIGKCTH